MFKTATKQIKTIKQIIPMNEKKPLKLSYSNYVKQCKPFEVVVLTKDEWEAYKEEYRYVPYKLKKNVYAVVYLPSDLLPLYSKLMSLYDIYAKINEVITNHNLLKEALPTVKTIKTVTKQKINDLDEEIKYNKTEINDLKKLVEIDKVKVLKELKKEQ